MIKRGADLLHKNEGVSNLFRNKLAAHLVATVPINGHRNAVLSIKTTNTKE